MAEDRGRVRLGRIATRQWGRISFEQLQRIGLSTGTIDKWLKQGYLYRVLPRVYGVGHRAPSVEADLAAALLYAEYHELLVVDAVTALLGRGRPGSAALREAGAPPAPARAHP
jgi:hypothetical protein